ncbi:MAG: deoxyguanosinetriphosphate triphosphohydrolase [Alphaproteobacteria bacterium]
MENYAPFACLETASFGRRFNQVSSNYRNLFQRDHDRIIHARAFRKLQHKTQVFVSHEGDFHRTRLTHSLEVAQVTRTICRALKVQEDLGVTIALAHDLGHPPFGHTGEDALNACLAVHGANKGWGSFDHNLQALRIVTKLESPYPEHAGMNLSFETLDGLAKHNGPISNPATRNSLTELIGDCPYPLDQQPCLEAQIAAVCDDIAYNCHDLDDGLRAGLLDLDDLAGIEQLESWVAAFRAQWPKANLSQQIYNLHRIMITEMINDLIAKTADNLAQHKINTPADVRSHPDMLASFSPELTSWLKPLRKFLFHRMYRHDTIKKHRVEMSAVVADLFGIFLTKPKLLPADWLVEYENSDCQHQVLIDYISGMTDRYALVRHKQLSHA